MYRKTGVECTPRIFVMWGSRSRLSGRAKLDCADAHKTVEEQPFRAE
jgi:hypothetical protein